MSAAISVSASGRIGAMATAKPKAPPEISVALLDWVRSRPADERLNELMRGVGEIQIACTLALEELTLSKAERKLVEKARDALIGIRVAVLRGDNAALGRIATHARKATGPHSIKALIPNFPTSPEANRLMFIEADITRAGGVPIDELSKYLAEACTFSEELVAGYGDDEDAPADTPLSRAIAKALLPRANAKQHIFVSRKVRHRAGSRRDREAQCGCVKCTAQAIERAAMAIAMKHRQ